MTRPSLADPDLERVATAWRDVDPDADHRRAIDDALADSTPSRSERLTELFAQPLQFGTAGLRGPLGPGPSAMNRVLVRLVAAALADVVGSTDDRGLVVIGYDARHGSESFALDTARVLAARGIEARLFDRPAPTPTLAFAVRELGATAGVMVTASHNPRTDNGYKIYGADGALLSPPGDVGVAQGMLSTPLLSDDDLAPVDDPHIVRVGEPVIEAYVERVVGLLSPGGERQIALAYTALHGVGGAVMARAFSAAGFAPAATVPDQIAPNGDFPGLAFPNPEEPGVLDRLFARATAAHAEVAIANDPDADRIAIAVRDNATWRLLSGDELGCLLAKHQLTRTGTAGPGRLVINTIVSSRLLGLIAESHGVHHAQTLTGFKWIMAEQAKRTDLQFVFGYEEALGYCVGEAVRDKDGIGTALVVAELAAELRARGATLLDALDELHRRHGIHLTGQRSLRFEVPDGPTSKQVMHTLRTHPPASLAGRPVLEIQDLLEPTGSLPPTDGVIVILDGLRLIVRPSGTEPKLKVYGEAWEPAPVTGEDLCGGKAHAHRRLLAGLDALSSLLCDPERADAARAMDSPIGLSESAARADALFAAKVVTLGRDEALRLTVRCIDLTTLMGDDTPGRVRALCAQARRPDPADPTVGPTAAICVYPNLVAVAADVLEGSGVAVASVATAFPSGLSALAVRLADISDALSAGAEEIDVVLNRAAFLTGDFDGVLAELRSMRAQIGERVMKVIIETGELATPGAIAKATLLAIDAGTDWVKTSTGKSAVSATPAAVLVMAEAIADHVRRGGSPVGIKISGGVRTSDDALGYLAVVEAALGSAWLHPSRLRFGASGLLGAVVSDIAAERR